MPLDDTTGLLSPTSEDRGLVTGTTLLLERARHRIRRRQNWCQFEGMRRGCLGQRQYCAFGAVTADGLGMFEDICGALNLLSEVAREIGYRTIAELNDRTNHAVVLAAFDDAIRLSRGLP